MKKYFILFILAGTLTLPNCNLDPSSVEGDPFDQPEIYHSPVELAAFLNTVNSDYPSITDLKIIGYSVEGRPVYALVISDNPSSMEVDEPKIRLSGYIHGNEYISGEVLIRFISHLTGAYDAAQPGLIETKLVNNRYIVVIPMINPDGVFRSVRNNSNNVDLNRNFDEYWTNLYDHGAYPFSEPESAAIRDFSNTTVFHLSVTYHSGAVVVNLPFDYGRKIDDVIPVENDFVEYLGLLYAGSGSQPFKDNPDIMTASGIINGGDWYVVNGSLQDWSYVDTGCMDMTIEVAESSPLTEAGIETVFQYNLGGMLAYIDAAGTGIYGLITDQSDEAPLEGVKVFSSTGSEDYDLQTVSDSNGYYFKVLEPGKTYTINYELTGYSSVDATADIQAAGDNIETNIQLEIQ